MIGLLLACYPRAWRRRYGDEFAAMLEARPLGPYDVADIFLGAIDARLYGGRFGSTATLGGGRAMSQRVGGWAAIAGGLIWLVVLVASSRGGGDGSVVASLVLLAGSALVLTALAGLSAFQARRYPRLVWASFAIPALGGLASIAGLLIGSVHGDAPIVLGVTPWTLWMGGVLAMTTGSALFAAATWRVRSLSRSAAAILFVGSVTFAPVAVGLVGLVPLAGELVLPGALAAFSGGWIAMGVSALRTGHPKPVQLATS